MARIDLVHLTFYVVRVAVVVVAEEEENMLVLSIYTQANIIDVVVDSSLPMFWESDERVSKIGRSLLSFRCTRNNGRDCFSPRLFAVRICSSASDAHGLHDAGRETV